MPDSFSVYWNPRQVVGGSVPRFKARTEKGIKIINPLIRDNGIHEYALEDNKENRNNWSNPKSPFFKTLPEAMVVDAPKPPRKVFDAVRKTKTLEIDDLVDLQEDED